MHLSSPIQEEAMTMSHAPSEQPQIVIVGGGCAGISVAARLRRALKSPNIVLLEPAREHYYQPLWTLVGGGAATKESTRRLEQHLIPRGVKWMPERVVELDPEAKLVRTDSGRAIAYDYLVLAAGIQIDWGRVRGLEGHVGQDGICSNYSYETVDSTWQNISHFSGGEAIFTQPSCQIKCGGAPQKIMYLADDAFRRRGVRSRTHITFMSGAPSIFSVKEYAATLNQVIARKEIETCYRHDLMAVRPASREAIFCNLDIGQEVVKRYDMLHVTPFMSAPDFIKHSPLAQPDGPQKGYAVVDKYTLQSPDYPAIFALGDCSALPTSKTGAAIRKQAPVLVRNLVAAIRKDTSSQATYDGYTSCPLVTGYGRLVLAEFDYNLKPLETFPVDQTKERLSMYLLKKYGLPVLYWQGMLKGRA
jgi:sulfide:quinone oxidoreductase